VSGPATPVDEVVRIEEHHAEDDREGHDSHPGSVGFAAGSGQVLNAAGSARNEPSVTAAAPPLGMFSAERPAPTRPHPADEDALVRRAAAGEPAAFRALFDRHKADVARLVWRMLNAPSDLDDVVQEVFVQVFRSLKDFRGQAKFSTWLHRVTVNVVLMHRRSARSRPVLTEEAPSDLVADAGQTLPDEDTERRERMRAFQRVLARLADKKRVVFVLHELEGQSPAEIAEIVGAPVLTVRTRLFYARREIEEMLQEEPSLASLAATFKKGGAR
jgi:RNA polymerase sigma-70 factor (ECF subfamily)